MQIDKVSIIGCGWLGLPLGEFLLQKNIEVKGTTTTPSKLEVLAAAGIQPFLLNFTPLPQGDDLLEILAADVVVIAVPPSKVANREDAYLQAMNHISQHIKDTKVIFISSTSVYPNLNRTVDESDIDLLAEGINQKILQAEQLWQAQLGQHCTILRMGGLMGYNRMPGRYYTGKKDLSGATTPVNLIHRDDAVAVIYEIMAQQKWGQVYNTVSDKHPSRKELFLLNARMAGFTPPSFAAAGTEEKFKVISNEKLKKDLNYQFIFSNPLDFTYTS